MQTLEQLVETLRSQGSEDSSGRFQLDLARARQVLAEYHLEGQDLWLLPLLQSSHRWESARVVVRFLRDAAVVEILACQTPIDLRPWLSQLGNPRLFFDVHLGPLVLACEVALAGGFVAVEFSTPQHSPVRLTPNGLEGPWESYESLRELKIRLQAPVYPWWQLRQKRLWSERVARSVGVLRQRAGYSLAQPLVEGLDLQPEFEVGEVPQGADEVERVWLSGQPLRQLMAYPGPHQRAFRHDWIGRRLARWQEGSPQGLLRQWVHAEQKALATDLHLGHSDHWLQHLLKMGQVTFPREVRRQEGTLAVRGVLQWNPRSKRAGRIIPVRWGITLGEVELAGCYGVTAWLSSDQWATDVSQQKVVANAVTKRSQEFVQSQWKEMLTEVVEAASLLPQTLGHLAEEACQAGSLPTQENSGPGDGYRKKHRR